MSQSPFYVVEEFISPSFCEVLVDELALTYPSFDETNQPVKYERLVPPPLAQGVSAALDEHLSGIETRYRGTVERVNMKFQQHWENLKRPAAALSGGAWKYNRKKWSKMSDFDLIGFLWLKDFQSSTPLDPRFEVYGGKLEFPAFNFSLVPVRGTLVVFPAVPNFMHAISHVMYGSIEQIILTIKLSNNGQAWEYKSELYPGEYKEWFDLT